MIELGENYFTIEVADPHHAVISGNTITWKMANAVGRGFVALPPGAWQIICTSKEVTDKGLNDLLPTLPAGRKTLYKGTKDGHDFWYNGQVDALDSLLASKGCDLNKNWLILKKQ